jgi:hypothetical protein
MPEFLAEKKYHNSTELLDTPFHSAWQTGKPMWAWLHEHPRETTYFNRFNACTSVQPEELFLILSFG